MSNEELLNISAGAKQISGTMINSVSRIINTLLDFGRTIGTSIRYIIEGRRC